jgi:hypothetical protein
MFFFSQLKLRFKALGISPEVQVHVKHDEELQLAGQSRVVEWSNVEQVYRHKDLTFLRLDFQRVNVKQTQVPLRLS